MPRASSEDDRRRPGENLAELEIVQIDGKKYVLPDVI